jgi:hypothetical protein
MSPAALVWFRRDLRLAERERRRYRERRRRDSRVHLVD